MEKYRLVPKAKELVGEHEIRVSSAGRIAAYISYAFRLFEQDKQEITVTATGNAIPRAVVVVELLKRRIPGLHQFTTTGCREITDRYEPIEQGLDEVTTVRQVAFMELKLTKNADPEMIANHTGYQPPIPADQVTSPRGGHQQEQVLAMEP
eukprot:Filipodium_phascolosomae@DN7403_c0_g1_i1.p1